MTGIKKGCYKYCIVPYCISTTIKTPNKIFFHVPLQKEKRKKWCKVMKRDLIGPKSIKYVCEDHFDVKNDTENLVKYKLVGGTLKLKTEVCPHKFNCQKVVKPEREEYKKRCGAEYVENNDFSSNSSYQPFEFIECGTRVIDEELNVPKDCTMNIPDNSKKKITHKRIQGNIKKDKQVQRIIRSKMNNRKNKYTDTIPIPIICKRCCSKKRHFDLIKKKIV